MENETAAETVVRGYWRDVWCEGRGAAVAAYYAPEIRENGEPVDIAAFGAAVESWFTKFPDFRATVDDLFVVGDRVVSRVTYTGTHHGTWAGLPATGRSFTALGLDVFRVDGRRIVEHWHSTDHYDLVVQLGGRVIPDDT
ncbi:MAG TPA: ester cyclase [Mycobacteriales bacterium]|nr:ester cyclase [Mycobacteriales bacterium]